MASDSFTRDDYQELRDRLMAASDDDVTAILSNNLNVVLGALFAASEADDKIEALRGRLTEREGWQCLFCGSHTFFWAAEDGPPASTSKGVPCCTECKRVSPSVSREREGWRDISTAPKDGTVIDLWVKGQRYANCYWYGDEEFGDEGKWRVPFSEAPDSTALILDEQKPSHWMPVPAPPGAAAPVSSDPSPDVGGLLEALDEAVAQAEAEDKAGAPEPHRSWFKGRRHGLHASREIVRRARAAREPAETFAEAIQRAPTDGEWHAAYEPSPAELLEALDQALRQWKSYAELSEDRSLAEEKSLEAELYQSCCEIGRRVRGARDAAFKEKSNDDHC